MGEIMKVHSIFQSINGEVCGSYQGSICTFVRFQGCNLRCSFCDTPDTQAVGYGTDMTQKEIIDIITDDLLIPTRNVTITGGEPFLQKGVDKLILKLLNLNFNVTVETNGSIKVPHSLIICQDSFSVHKELTIVMDYKPFNCYGNDFDLDKYWGLFKKAAFKLSANDWVKYPIRNKKDFYDALMTKGTLESSTQCSARSAFSAIKPLSPRKLLSWLIEEEVGDFVLNVQLHKVIKVP
jgi:7-carboxy-7-deazaguanine synthase